MTCAARLSAVFCPLAPGSLVTARRFAVLAVLMTLAFAWTNRAVAQDAAAEPADAAAAAEVETPMNPFMDNADLGGNAALPEAIGPFAQNVDSTLMIQFWVSVGFFLLIFALLVLFSWKYRQRDRDYVPGGKSHHTALELTWSFIPAIFLLAFFVLGFRGYLNMSTPPEGSYPITARAWQWGWDFTYPNGYSDKDLHIQADTPILITNVSGDVIHSLYIPAFRIKKDVVPGRYNQMWFQAEFNGTPDEVFEDTIEWEDGTQAPLRFNRYDLYCTEYCGTSHANMNRKVFVHTKESYKNWLRGAVNIKKDAPVDAGKKIWTAKCKSCHSIDGSGEAAPTWKDLWGQPNHMMTTGPLSEPVGAEYIRESIEKPQAKVVAGYPRNGMAPWFLSDAEYLALFEFMKANSVHYTGKVYTSKEDWAELLGEETPAAEGSDAGEPADASTTQASPE